MKTILSIIIICTLIVLMLTSCADNQQVDTQCKIESEEVSCVVTSVEELKSTINASRTTDEDNNVYKQNKISEINYFFEPAVPFEGYDLYFIEVNEYSFFYYYMPVKALEEMCNPAFINTIGIIVSISREPYKDEPLQPIIDQYGVKPDNSGYIFIKKHNEVIWAIDKTRASITFPKSFTKYNEMVKYCKANRVEIN